MTDPGGGAAPPGKVALDVVVPSGWEKAALDAPDLSQAPQIVLEQWEAWRPPSAADAILVVGCFYGQASGWAEEADDAALDQLGHVASSTGLRVAGVGGLARGAKERAGPVTSVRFEGTADGQGVLAASAFLGFTGTRAHGCFALCSDRAQRCTEATAGARLAGALTAPPPPSAGLRALLALVHHPAAAGWGVAGAFVLTGALAVVTRHRPRSRRRGATNAR